MAVEVCSGLKYQNLAALYLLSKNDLNLKSILRLTSSFVWVQSQDIGADDYDIRWAAT